MADVQCFGCGALVPEADGPVHAYMLAAPGCWAMFCSILDWKYSDLAALGPETSQGFVDSYAAQHATNVERRNRQSVAVHLMSLCAALEHDLREDRRRVLIGRLAHREYTVLEPTPTSFAVTIRDVFDAEDQVRQGVVRDWEKATWDAWSVHHEQLRAWLSVELRSINGE